jgi:hypothetical protein
LAQVQDGIVPRGLVVAGTGNSFDAIVQWLQRRSLPSGLKEDDLRAAMKDVPESERELVRNKIYEAGHEISSPRLPFVLHVSVYPGEHGPVFLVSSTVMLKRPDGKGSGEYYRRVTGERIVGPGPDRPIFTYREDYNAKYPDFRISGQEIGTDWIDKQ